jgi:hypothetical protein
MSPLEAESDPLGERRDPTSYIQVIDYDVPAEIEINRSRIAGEPRLQAFLQSWRAMTGGAVEIDVFREVKEKG